LHKAIHFCPNGKIALIFNSKVLTNSGTTYQSFRNWLFNETNVEKIYNFSILRKAPDTFGGQLFGSAVGPISVVFYENKIPVNSDRIIYYAPKTYVKNNVLEGVSIDSSDVKYLSRKDCQKADSKIWKVAMWGGMSDLKFLEKLNLLPSLGDFVKSKGIKKGLGLQFLDSSTKNPLERETIPQKYLHPKDINRYVSNSFIKLKNGLTENGIQHYERYYNKPISNISDITVFRRIGAELVYKAPLVLIKEGLQDWRICSSFIGTDCAFNSKVLGFSFKDEKILKGLTCFLNSKLAYYFLFISSASIGIEREEIKPNEIYNLPFVLNDKDLHKLSDIYDKYISDSINFTHDIQNLDFEVDEFIFGKYDFTDIESSIIEDFIDYTIPLLSKKNNTPFNPLKVKTIKAYSNQLCHSLNDFLEGQNIYANATIYSTNQYSPLVAIKLTFDEKENDIAESKENIVSVLSTIDKHLWEEKSSNIYFRKKINFKPNESTYYLIRPNQMRFWTRTMAIEDASELILEILNED